jgi:RHS repeat-associated protein
MRAPPLSLDRVLKTEKPLFPEPAPGTGQEKDKETATLSDPTGEMHYRARAYSPRQMRFVQNDPPTLRRARHQYLYVDNAPTMQVDPTGARVWSTGEMDRRGVELMAKVDLIDTREDLESRISFDDGSGTTRRALQPYVDRIRQAQANAEVPFGRPNTFVAAKAEQQTHRLVIRNSARTADQLFQRILSLQDLDPKIVKADRGFAQGEATSFALQGLLEGTAQAPFAVQVRRLDATAREVTVRTQGNHPLAGFRTWRVREDGDAIIVETVAIDHPATRDAIKSALGGRSATNVLWQKFLEGVALYSAGRIDDADPRTIRAGRWTAPEQTELDYVLRWNPQYANTK